MIRCDYKEIIDRLNNGEIKLLRFCVNDYSHYKNCVIEGKKQKLPSGEFFLIEVRLTNDSSEKIAFLDSFIENTKLFRMGKKGSFTLKQVWSKITILEIVYH